MRVNVWDMAWSGLLGLMVTSGCIIVDGSGDDGANDSAATTTGAEGSGDDMTMADESGDTGTPPPAEVPDNDYCSGVANWTEQESAFEEEVLVLVNMERAAGASCGGQPFGAAGPLTMNAALRCSSRVHSLDMAVRGFFDHDNPDGEDPFTRMERAGYSYSAAGENIAAGQTTPAEVVQGWMDSPGHCSNIMDSNYTELGVGYAATSDAEFPHYWTQNFGRP